MNDEILYPPMEEEEGGLKACEPAEEPACDYPTAEVTSVDIGIADLWDPGIGPYSMDELNTRIDKAEEAIKRAKSGDMSGWISETQSRENLYNRFPWLR